MTMGGLVLFTVVTWVMFGSSYSETKFAGLMDLSDRLVIDGFGFCGAICMAPNLHEHVNKTLYQCQNNLIAIREETRQLGLGAEAFYNFAIKRQGSSNSRMCKWAHSLVDGCVGKLVMNHCDHSGIKREMTRMMKEAKDYVCSLDPPVMECAMHHEVIKNAHLCAAPLLVQFRKYSNGTAYTMEEQRKQFQRFYNGEIKMNNAESLYTAFKTLGTCVFTLAGQSIVQGKSCSKVKDLLDEEIDNVIAYFKKTDMLKCNFDPELWTHLMECDLEFSKALEDRATTPDPSRYKGPMRYDPLPHLVEEFKRFADDDYQLLKDPLKKFTRCTLAGINTVCGKKWTYTVVQMQLTLLENIFNPKDKTVPQHCETLIKAAQQGSPASTSKAVVTNMAALVILRLLTMY